MRINTKLVITVTATALLLLAGEAVSASSIQESLVELEADLKGILHQHKYGGHQKVWVDIRAEPLAGEAGRVVVHATDAGGYCQWHFVLQRAWPDYFKPALVSQQGNCTYHDPAFVADGAGLGVWYDTKVAPYFATRFPTLDRSAPVATSVHYQPDRVTLTMRLTEVRMKPELPRMIPLNRLQQGN